MILHVITGLGNGGAESLLDAMVRHDSGEEHVVVSLHTDGHYGVALREHGIEVHTLDMPRGRLTRSGVMRLYRLLRERKPRVVQTWMYHANLLGGLLARLAGCPRVVWGLHNNRMAPGTASRSMIVSNALCARLSGSIPRRVIHCSASGAREHVEDGYSERTMRVVPNGYDVARYHPDADARHAVRASLGLDATTPLIGMIARWHPQKDHANLVAGIAALPAARREGLRVLLVGTDMTDSNVALGELIERAGLVADFILLGERRDVPALMNALDLFVLSSAFGESFPNVVNEAMASGTPCVVTDVGDSGTIVGDTGWVVPPSDAAALATAVVDALDEVGSEAWTRRREACRQRVVENYTLEVMVSRYRAIWQEAAGSIRAT